MFLAGLVAMYIASLAKNLAKNLTKNLINKLLQKNKRMPVNFWVKIRNYTLKLRLFMILRCSKECLNIVLHEFL